MIGHVAPIKLYVAIFLGLLVLTGATVAVAYVDLGPWNTVVAVSIAVLKALFVLLYFMHLLWSEHLTWIFAGAGVFWLVVLIALTQSDYLTRAWLP